MPPRYYGGIERIVDMLARGLEARGHAVTLFAHGESATAGRLIPWPGKSSPSKLDVVRNAARLATEVASGAFDLVHSFSRLAYLAPILPLPIPKLMTYQRPISPMAVSLGHRLSGGSLEFTAISRWMTREVERMGRWHLVPNGVPLARYDFGQRVARDAPLVFLGRLEEIKGPHLAIEVAKRCSAPLVLAGNVPEAHRGWFEAAVAPHIDGDRIRYVGPVDDAQKNALLGSARALLMPILWDEPFGIVMAEAMACGAPVIGLDRGAVPEVVEHGVTGFVESTVDGLVEAMGRLPSIDRRRCRARVERLYSEEAVVDGYLAVYSQALERRAAA